MLDASNGHFIEAVARFHDGSGAIDAVIKKRGAFDLNLVSKEGQLEVERFEAGLKVLGVTVSDLEKPYQQAAQSTKHLATEQEQAAKKIADSDRQLTESTAFGKYNSTIDDLTAAFKRNGISQATYSQGIDNANETLLKNTDYVVANAKALELQAKARDKYLGHVNDYNATIDESTSNFASGSISKQQHGLNVATANAGLMNQVTDTQIPVSKVGEVIDAQSAIKSTDEMAKFTDETTKAIEKLDSFGNSGKMAFDGLLGGISAVASAATSFSDEMEKLNNHQNAYAANYNKFMADSTKSEAEKADATKQFAVEKEAYNAKSLETEIGSARSIAGATANMFSEKSAARKAFHAVEMTLGAVEMAMSAGKMIVDVAAGAANMFAQGGFAGFAGVAAMMAVMGGLGFAGSSSGSVKTIDTTNAEAPTAGTVAGDNTASSKSIQNSMQMLVDLSAKQVAELKDLNSNFTAIMQNLNAASLDLSKEALKILPSTIAMKNTPQPTTAIVNPLGSTGSIAGSLGASVALGAAGTTAVALAATSVAIDTVAGECTALGATAAGLGAAATATAASVGASVGATAAAAELIGGALLGLGAGLVLAAFQYGLGKLLGIGKTKYTAIGGGIITSAVEFTQAGMQEAMTTYDYSTIEATTKGWFSNTVRIYDIVNGINAEMTDTMTTLFQSIFTGLKDTFAGLKLNNFIDWNVIIPDLKLSTYGKTPDEINKLFSDVINNMSDQMATAMAGGLFSNFVKSGEGMVQTITRVASEVGVVTDGFHKLGLGLAGNALVTTTFADSMANLYESMPGANDGLKNFTSAIDAFYNTILTKNQQVSLSLADYSKYASDPANASVNYQPLNRYRGSSGGFD